MGLRCRACNAVLDDRAADGFCAACLGEIAEYNELVLTDEELCDLERLDRANAELARQNDHDDFDR